jgi:predicted metalloendopeptidase
MYRTLFVALLAMSSEIVRAADLPSSIPEQSSGINLQYVDSSSRSQDNFFHYVSGKWLDSAEIPTDRARYGAFDQLRDLAEQQLRAIIDELARAEDLARGSEARKIADL